MIKSITLYRSAFVKEWTSNRLSAVVFTLLCLLLLTNIVRVWQLQDQIIGAGDQYTYWFYGHFLREQVNPYIAYITDALPKTPVDYVDGRTFNRVPSPPGGVHAPTNNPPLIIFLSAMSWFSWYAAKPIWLVINALLALSLPFILLRIANRYINLSFTAKHLFIVMFWSSAGVRLTLNQGQTALAILLFTILFFAKLAQREHLYAGVFLGFALSKYSLTAPLVLVCLLWQAPVTIFVAGIVQILGIVGVSFYTGTSPTETVRAIVEIVLDHTSNKGIHLSDWLPYGEVVLIGLSVVLAWRLRHFFLAYRPPADAKNRFIVLLHFVTITLGWILHIGYHNRSDAVVFMFLFLLVVIGYDLNIWKLSLAMRGRLLVLTAAFIVLLALPIDSDLLPYAIRQIVGFLGAFSSFLATIAAAVLFWRFEQIRLGALEQNTMIP